MLKKLLARTLNYFYLGPCGILSWGGGGSKKISGAATYIKFESKQLDLTRKKNVVYIRQ